MSMEYYKITANPLDYFPQHNYHFHSAFEIYYFVSGDANYLVEGKEYHLTPHSLLLLSSNVLHGIRVNSNEEYIRYCLYLSPNDILPERRTSLFSVFPNNPAHLEQAVFYENLQEYHFVDFFEQLQFLETLPKTLRNKCRPIFLESFLAQIYIMFQVRHPSSTSSAASQTILSIIEYINSHLTEPLTLDSLSERFYINKHYMDKAFKKATGSTIINYLLFKRVILAKEYIANGESASNAALMVGFSDYSTFYRAYKRILGAAPSSAKSPTI